MLNPDEFVICDCGSPIFKAREEYDRNEYGKSLKLICIKCKKNYKYPR